MDLFVVGSRSRIDHQGGRPVSELLRHHGLAVEMDPAGRSVKGQFKQADRVNAAHTLILEPGGTASLRNMETGDQRTVDPESRRQPDPFLTRTRPLRNCRRLAGLGWQRCVNSESGKFAVAALPFRLAARPVRSGLLPGAAGANLITVTTTTGSVRGTTGTGCSLRDAFNGRSTAARSVTAN